MNLQKGNVLLALAATLLLAACAQSSEDQLTNQKGPGGVIVSPSKELAQTSATSEPADKVEPTPEATAQIAPVVLSAEKAPIVFTLYNLETEANDVVTINMDGTGLKNVTNGLGPVTWPKWSPDHQSIVFVLYGEDFSTIHAIGADGQNPRQLTDFISSYPAWYSDGKRILFSTEFETGAERIYDLFSINSDGTGLAKVMDSVDAGNRDASISPDGTRLAFISNRYGNWEIAVASLAEPDATPTRLTDYADFDGYPSWSPDGSKILFARLSEGGNVANIWVMEADGANQTPLTDTQDWNWHPAWSPDGEYIVFISNRNGPNDLWIMEADGSNPVQITFDDNVEGSPDW